MYCERHLELKRFLQRHPNGASREEIFSAIKDYRLSRAPMRMFIRDINKLRSMGFIIPNCRGQSSPRYRIQCPSRSDDAV